jgi:ADP-ribose pyrophosphatase YjhB (NUDIX family)
MPSKWLEWARKIQSLAQAGITYSTNGFDQERYHSLLEIAAEITAQHAGLETETVQALFADQAGYVTPKVDVRGAIFRDNQLLLVQEMLDGGRWTLPGGWADSGETPRQAVEREVREETGYQVHATKLAAVLDRDTQGHPAYFFTVYKFFFLCELVGGKPLPSIETGESAFFAEEALPPLSTPRVLEHQIHRLFRHHRQPDLPTDFD